MHVALVKIKASSVFIVFLLCLSFEKYAEAQGEDDKNTKIARKVCLLKPDPGPCRANIVTYYFDPKKMKCRKFAWGGCQGNGNRFSSREECYSNCIISVRSLAHTRPRFCDLNFDYGYCFGSLSRYYYDPLWKVCKERLYSGCGGNQNNFYNIEQCNTVCRLGNGYAEAINSKMKKKKGKKVIIVNPVEDKTQTTKKGKKQKKKTGADGEKGEDGT